MEQYISKDAVVAEINRVLNSYDPNEITSGRYALTSLRDFLNTLEVKEVDLGKEISFQWSKFCLNGKDKNFFVKIAEHFFEFGLKAQKGE